MGELCIAFIIIMLWEGYEGYSEQKARNRQEAYEYEIQRQRAAGPRS